MNRPARNRTLALLALVEIVVGGIVAGGGGDSTLRAAPPSLTHLVPQGAQRGSEGVLTAQGSFPQWPVNVHVEGQGVTIEAAEKKGELKFKVAADAQPGVYLVRVSDAEGASPLKPFLVGQEPEVSEQEPNDAISQALAVKPPQVVNGVLSKSGDIDTVAVTLQRGQTVVAAIDANRWWKAPVDCVLQISNSQGLVYLQRDDTLGIDPRLVFTAPVDGDYYLRVFGFPETPNSTIGFAGGSNFIYRLTVTTGPFLDHVLPLLPNPNDQQEWQLFGYNLAAATGAARPPELNRVQVFPAGVAGGLVVPVTPHASRAVAPGSFAGADPVAIELPVTVSSHLADPGAAHRYRFAAAKGQKLQLALVARRLGFATDAVLSVHDAEGKQLKEVDDVSREADPKLDFSVPADGQYEVQIRDLHNRGGLRFAYALTIAETAPDFQLAPAAGELVLEAGKEVELEVTIERQGGYAEAIELVAEGLPAGVQCAAATSAAKGDSSKKVKLKLVADAGAAAAQTRWRVLGKAGELVRPAQLEIAGLQTDALWLTVKPKP